MANERLTIGELSRRSGVPVKTLRFYSDEGLLPPVARSSTRYRLYGEDSLVRLELIRALRDAGLAIDAIKRVLRRELSLTEALRLRLVAVEAHVASLQRVAAALRAALRSTPNEDDIRRLTAVTRLSNEERKAVIQGFYDRIGEGVPIDAKWKEQMVEAAAPKLPDDPTPAQLDAWIEMTEMMADPAFVEGLRNNAKEVWGKFDMNKMREAGDVAAAAAKAALAKGATPESEEARRIVEDYGRALAAARGGEFDEAMRRGMRERFAKQDPRAARYWELVAIMRGTTGTPSRVAEWAWIQAAVIHHLA